MMTLINLSCKHDISLFEFTSHSCGKRVVHVTFVTRVHGLLLMYSAMLAHGNKLNSLTR